MRILYLIIVFFLSSVALVADDNAHEHEEAHEHNEFEQHTSHEHGQATANISYIEDTLIIDLDLPSIDVFGFEHAPSNENEDEVVFLNLAKLEDINNIVATEPACALISTNVTSDILPNSETHEHGDKHSDEMHSDVKAAYELHCSSAIKLIFTLFDHFKSLEKITVQYVSAHEQKLFTVTPDSSTISLHR